MNILSIKRFLPTAAMLAAALFISACSSMGSTSSGTDTSRAALTDRARTTLNSLYGTTPRARELRANAKAILVFPDILKAGLIVGGSGGNGVLFSPDGQVLGYYNLSAVSFGMQAGAQNFSEAMFLMNPKAINALNSYDGWSIGAGPSVVVLDQGMAADLDTTTLRSDVYAFIFGQQGLMGGLGVQGQKITKLNP